MTSIKDVAQLAGVSTATVSRALSEPGKVSQRTRDKVTKAIQESGYVANSLARNFRRRRTNMVVVLVPDITNSFFAGVIQGIERVANKNKYRVLLGDTQYSKESERDYAELVAQRQADGVISLGSNIPFDYRKGRKTLDSAWPPFAMACEYDGVIPVPTVCIDNVSAAVDAVQHLTRLGHTKVAYINGPSDSPICKDRLKGYRKAMRKVGESGLSRWTVSGDYSLASGRSAMRQLLAGEEVPTAVFAANDEMAIGAIAEIKAQGLSVPDDISVVGFDDIAFSEYSDPPLTTIHQPRLEIGEQVMSLMLSLLSDEAIASDRIVLPHALISRASTAAPKP